MNTTHFDALARSLATSPTTRRGALLRAAGLGAGMAGVALMPAVAEAKRKRKPRSKPLCRENGSPCKKKGPTCRAGNCLTTPFTIEAAWTSLNSLYDTYLFVPKEAGNSAPSPFIRSTECTPAASDCDTDVYPFTCISQNASGPGPEIATIRKLLKGIYEYWIYVISNSPAGAVTVTLRDANGQDVRTWSSPVNPNPYYLSWHVFDIDGAVGSVKSVNQTNSNGMPGGAHSPNTNVCNV